MTREYAARILHPDTSREAQEEIGATMDDVNEACVMGAEALREIESGRFVKLPYLSGERIYVLCDYVQRGYRTTRMAGYAIRHIDEKPHISFQCTACSHWYRLDEVFGTLEEVKEAHEKRIAQRQRDKEAQIAKWNAEKEAQE